MPDVLFVQNTRLEGSGYLGELTSDDGFEIQSIYAKQEKLPETNFKLVVILGAPESANDNLPYLEKEKELIKKCVEQDIPVLGICLGSQLIAKTFGGKVYTGVKKEIGFYNDLIPESNSGLFSNFENPFTVFHWHGDTFDLPPGATRLAHSEIYQNQAFQYHSAIGLQFHLEVNEEMINLWLDKTEEKLENIPYIDPQKIRCDIEENILSVKNNMDTFYSNFKSKFNL
ncbi:MAG: type 1 glutamine amidotransferase [Nitrosopumilaceae archaeon]|nr:type 1 glutamine amidotransferase [Nitrosopumilaceae archaeon]